MLWQHTFPFKTSSTIFSVAPKARREFRKMSYKEKSKNSLKWPDSPCCIMTIIQFLTSDSMSLTFLGTITYTSISYVRSGLLLFFLHLQNFSIIWRHHHCQRKASKFDIYSALKTIDQSGFFLACYSYYDMEHQFSFSSNQMSEDPWHSHPSV